VLSVWLFEGDVRRLFRLIPSRLLPGSKVSRGPIGVLGVSTSRWEPSFCASKWARPSREAPLEVVAIHSPATPAPLESARRHPRPYRSACSHSCRFAYKKVPSARTPNMRKQLLN